MLDLIANIRHGEICELLKKQRAVTTASLAEKFGVSVETIRKDLMLLEKEARLVRVHGGAVLRSADKPYVKLSRRMESMQREKTEISRLAAALVENGDTVLIDAGSTAAAFAAELMQKLHSLTVITHSLDVFQRLCGYKDFEVILCGGEFLKSENLFYGDFAEHTLENVHARKAFIFPSALSLKSGICDADSRIARMQRKLISASDEVIVVADSSKLERSALIKVSDMSPAFLYITDSGLPPEIKELYQSNEIKVITPSKGGGE